MIVKPSILRQVRMGAVGAVLGGAVLLAVAPMTDAAAWPFPYWTAGSAQARQTDARRTLQFALCCIDTAARNFFECEPGLQAVCLTPATGDIAAWLGSAEGVRSVAVHDEAYRSACARWMLRLTHLPPPTA